MKLYMHRYINVSRVKGRYFKKYDQLNVRQNQSISIMYLQQWNCYIEISRVFQLLRIQK